MHILISGLWGAKEPSGICRTVASLIRGLKTSPSCPRVTLAIGSWQKAYFKNQLRLKNSDAELHVVDISNNAISRNAWYAFGLASLARELAPDLVHLSFPAPVARRSYSCPIVVCLHDLYPYDCPENFGFPRVFANRLFVRQALRAADRIVCVSQHTMRQLIKRFPQSAARSSCIPNAIEIHSETQSRRIVPEPYFLAVAQHRANKNLELLIESFHRCKDLRLVSSDTKLLIVGSEGPETPRLRDRVRHFGLQHEVVFFSSLPDVDLASLYCNCELFLTLSSIEGYGLALGEALACRARIVASDISAHREIGADYCQYVDVSGMPNANSVIASIHRALQRSRPPVHAVNHLSLGALGKQYLALFHDAVESCAGIHTGRISTQEAVAK